MKTYADHLGINMKLVEEINLVLKGNKQSEVGMALAAIMGMLLEDKSKEMRIVALDTFKVLVLTILDSMEALDEPETTKGAGTRPDDPSPSTRDDH